MNCLTEALGMGLRGNGTIPAVYSARLQLATPNMAGVENNQVGRFGRRRLFVAQIFQNSGNAL